MGARCSPDKPCSFPLACVEDTCTGAATPDSECSDLCPTPTPGQEKEPAEVIGMACQAYADDVCASLARCTPALVTSVYGDPEQCELATRDACERAAAAEDVYSTSAGIMGCGTALQTVSCEEMLNRDLPEDCRLYPGTRTNDSVCSVDAQCMSKRCALDTSESCGTCQELAEEGGSCLRETDCQVGLVCPSSRVCTRPRTGNESCAADQPCAYPLVCAGDTCKTALPKGARCDVKKDACNTYLGDICGPVSNVCESLRYAGPGAVCGFVGTGWTVCKQSASCVGDPGSQRCKPAAGEGEACTDAGPSCTPLTRCVKSVCSLTSPAECS